MGGLRIGCSSTLTGCKKAAPGVLLSNRAGAPKAGGEGSAESVQRRQNSRRSNVWGACVVGEEWWFMCRYGDDKRGLAGCKCTSRPALLCPIRRPASDPLLRGPPQPWLPDKVRLPEGSRRLRQRRFGCPIPGCHSPRHAVSRHICLPGGSGSGAAAANSWVHSSGVRSARRNVRCSGGHVLVLCPVDQI